MAKRTLADISQEAWEKMIDIQAEITKKEGKKISISKLIGELVDKALDVKPTVTNK